LYIWGDNKHGQLGHKDVQADAAGGKSAGWARVVFLSMNGEHTLAVTYNGALCVWDEKHFV